MNVRILAVAVTLLATLSTSAFAQGLDSAKGPYSPSAYAGYVVPRADGPYLTHRGSTAAYHYAGSHAGGPANNIVRW